MKKLLSLIFLIGLAQAIFAQEKGNITGKFYITNVDLKVEKYNLIYGDTTGEYFIAKASTKFTAYEIVGDKILVKFWNFRDTTQTNKSKNSELTEHKAPQEERIATVRTSPQTKSYSQQISGTPIMSPGDSASNNEILLQSSPQSQPLSESRKQFVIDHFPLEYKNRYISFATNGEYFLIDAKDFNTKTSEFHGRSHSFAWGFSTLPIKLRFGGPNSSFEYSTGFSLGINAGYEYQFKSRVRQSIGVLFGIGVSTVNVTPESTQQIIDKHLTTGAFVPTLSLIYSYSNFQIGTFVGADFIPGEIGKNWVYKNKPWLGLGLGFTIFQRNKTDNSREQSQASH